VQHRACLTWSLRCLCASAIVVLAPITIAAEEGEHGQPSVLGGDIGNIFFTLLIFGLLVVSLGKLAWKPLLRLLQQREEFIRDSIEGARREREEADKLLAEYRTQIDRAREEATAIVEEGKRDAGDVARRIQAEARKEGDEMIARARREIQLAKDTAVKELYDRTAELAVQVAGRVIGKTLSADEHRALVTESLERMKSSDEAKLN
jgi:F-type H+-transporting ATPase subunit b